MTFIDTHCHIYLDTFEGDLDLVLQRAADAGVTEILMPAIDTGSLSQMDRLNHPEITFRKMAGLHPGQVGKVEPLMEEELYDLAAADDIVGVGETGLDYYWSMEHVEEQKINLEIHCRVAKALGKPIVLHNRESTKDLLDLIEREQDGTLRGVWHCFTGTVGEGRRAIDLGLSLGIGGVLTFKNAGVDRSVRKLPLGSMILETDAPWLTPAPHRAKRNEPAMLVHTAEKLADLKGLPLEEVAERTSARAGELFGLSVTG